MGGTLVKTDLGHGRGWASPKAAASIRRIDAQLGRLADINEAGRSPEQANVNRARWLAYERYLNGGPWAPKAPYALGADQSVHCWGNAADSDDWYNAHAAAVWRDNGWKQTARYFDRNGRPTAKDEPWHGEYFEHLDNHRNDPAPAAAGEDEPQKENFDMEAYVIVPSGAAVHLFNGGRNVFGSQQEYETYSQEVQFIRDRGGLDMAPVPALGSLVKVSWATFERLRGNFGVPDDGAFQNETIDVEKLAKDLASRMGFDPAAVRAAVRAELASLTLKAG